MHQFVSDVLAQVQNSRPRFSGCPFLISFRLPIVCTSATPQGVWRQGRPPYPMLEPAPLLTEPLFGKDLLHRVALSRSRKTLNISTTARSAVLIVGCNPRSGAADPLSSPLGVSEDCALRTARSTSASALLLKAVCDGIPSSDPSSGQLQSKR